MTLAIYRSHLVLRNDIFTNHVSVSFALFDLCIFLHRKIKHSPGSWTLEKQVGIHGSSMLDDNLTVLRYFLISYKCLIWASLSLVPGPSSPYTRVVSPILGASVRNVRRDITTGPLYRQG